MTQEKLGAAAQIASELNIKQAQVAAAISLMDEGATVPFIARYRKEVTQGLDDTQLRFLQERLHYIRELDERRKVILNSIQEQNKLTEELKQRILAADTKARLEDLYLPFKPKRKTKASIAIEAGLKPLALTLLNQPENEPETLASTFIQSDKEINDTATALEGAKQILLEHFTEDALLIDQLREYLWNHAFLHSQSHSKKEDTNNKYSDYKDHAEPIKKIPSHRALAMFRGRREGYLKLSLKLPEHDSEYGESTIAGYFGISQQHRPADSWLLETVRQSWKTKLFTKLELELLTRLRERSDEEAIKVFACNLRDLLLAAPAGAKVTMGLDPGIRTGVKAAIVDETGKLLDCSTVYPFSPQNEWHQSLAELAKLAAKYHVSLISIGNGTASRETDRLIADMIKMYPDLSLNKVMVSEAGASVYSASEIAAQEFPDIDVSLRGAISIARRLQDPLAELVKIEPKSIGVGQYQHDVNQTILSRTLDAVVEDCVNAVGVNLNTSSSALLTHVSGLNETLAKNIVQYRDKYGEFTTREQIKEIERLGEKTFQQAAGFLRISNGENPLDATGVHPESYSLVEQILTDHQLALKDVLGNKEKLQSLNLKSYVTENVGFETLNDIRIELEKPGRDPRPEFRMAQFKEGIEDISHLEEGMMLEGVVSNVTNFGAFIDIGVHQDGLVHISAMTDRFIKDPRKIVKAGDIVKVKVLEVDLDRRRINLTMKLDTDKKQAQTSGKIPAKKMKSKKPENVTGKKTITNKSRNAPVKQKKVFNTAMADALAKLKEGLK